MCFYQKKRSFSDADWTGTQLSVFLRKDIESCVNSWCVRSEPTHPAFFGEKLLCDNFSSTLQCVCVCVCVCDFSIIKKEYSIQAGEILFITLSFFAS